MKNVFVKKFLIWTMFVLLCAGILIFVQEMFGIDLFSPIIVEYKF